MIRAIVALDDKQGIAANGGIPWDIPEDKQYFREHTEHGIVIMGWATYEEFAAPLPNRRNIVASRTPQSVRPGFELTTDVAALLRTTPDDAWIIGGAGLFGSTLQFCDELYITRVVGDFGCDRFFPPFEDVFTRAEQSAWCVSGVYQYRFEVYRRTKNR